MTWWVIFTLSVVIDLFGDVAMKEAGLGAVRCGWLAAGFSSYAATSLAWFWLLRTRTLSSFGSLFPVANAIGLVILGAVIFRERMGVRTWAGVAVGLVSLLLLSKE